VSAAGEASRIGCVRYLNSKPLIHGHAEGVSFETPASLADGLRSGRLDVALAPIFELIAHPGYAVVDDVAIASLGPVYSVFIAYQGELEQLHTLYLDPASRSSVNLQRVLLAEFYQLRPKHLPLPPEGLGPLAEGEGALLIGDLAIAYRAQQGGNVRYLDLGEAWLEATGLPFVFAAWLVRPGAPDEAALADRLRDWRAAGCARVEEIVAQAPPADQDFTRTYLTRHIRFRLGDPEKAAIQRYADLLHRHGVVHGPAFSQPRWI
jgi:predicted solute-binding protein